MVNIKKIIVLHTEITEALKSSLEKAILIGQLLTEQKKELNHGEFTSWIKENLPFTGRTARNYIKLFNNKDMLITERVSDLTAAYKLLSTPANSDTIEGEYEAALGKAVLRLQEIITDLNSKHGDKFPDNFLQLETKDLPPNIVAYSPNDAVYSLCIQALHKLSKQILKENNSLDEILQLRKYLLMAAQDCASLLLDAEAQLGELLKEA